MFKRVAIVGVGFMGGSFALALREAVKGVEILGVDINPKALEKALDLKVIDRAYERLDDLENVGLVVLASPVRTFYNIAKSLKQVLDDQTIVTDMGSVKGKLVYELENILGKKFVGGHPIAGTEKSGVENSRKDLFKGKRFILTPTPNTDQEAKRKVSELWSLLGSYVEEMDPYVHDYVFGCVSHLPHAVAFALIDALINLKKDVDLFKYPGAGFRDFTRIAASDPIMWRDIFLENKENVLTAIDVYISSLQKLVDLIREGREEELTSYLKEAREHRLRLEE
ncbi:prephenate dehydrogenase [Thermocrinis minervae]|uniref:prephenate dehydrogenase n=1 Tax=Thermocrinis minervae TaxID=381751 RepID=A0A1M6R5H3_9AQUI|nr:prephenate dehydrogenase/arogenate dehydrogenase family protein [Thermocrinis minervae]SHK27702.1 prephenate dehydrogenase [Thermocrinis minervae]